MLPVFTIDISDFSIALFLFALFLLHEFEPKIILHGTRLQKQISKF